VKRFWTSAEAVDQPGGWAVQLDGKPLLTPGRSPLVVPTAGLAEAIADEWRSVEENIDPRSMPLTGLANAAIERVAPTMETFADGLARYAEADLACYRSDGPKLLVERQQASWDPLLAWARRRFDVDFCTTSGLVHVAQPQATVDRLAHAVRSLGPFELAGVSPLVTISGSLIAALGVVEQAFPAERAWAFVTVDEQWQLEQWGADPRAAETLENRRRDFMAAARFLDLLRD
jgi:chaperone required for assembly of F1-ATPase